MRRTLGLTFFLVLGLVSSARADLALPKDLQYIDPRVQFDGVEKHADHVFYLRYLTFTGGPAGVPHRLVEVKDTKAFPLNAQRRLVDMTLLALGRKEFEKRAKEDATLKWLHDKTEGVLKVGLQTPSTTAKVGLKEVPVTTYRVKLRDGQLTAEMVQGTKSGDVGPASLVPLWLVGILGATSLAWLGVWYTRRSPVKPQA